VELVPVLLAFVVSVVAGSWLPFHRRGSGGRDHGGGAAHGCAVARDPGWGGALLMGLAQV
jgi:hypothetical protein